MKKILIVLFFILLSCTKSTDDEFILDIKILGPDKETISFSEKMKLGKSKEVLQDKYKLDIMPTIENKSEFKLKVKVHHQTKRLGSAKLTTFFNHSASIHIKNIDKHYKVTLTPRKIHLK